MDRYDFDPDDLFEPANENARPNPLARRVPRHVERGRTDLLLSLAGFDPDKIPRRYHAAALPIAWCFEQGLFDIEAIKRAARLSGKTLIRTITSMLEH